tara:strand:+ start:838 stop:1470 length:633 start_codon:yes stop_codon:yes gene_type:complete
MTTTLLAFVATPCILTDSLLDRADVSAVDVACLWAVLAAWLPSVFCSPSLHAWRRATAVGCNATVATSCTVSTCARLSITLGEDASPDVVALTVRCVTWMIVACVFATSLFRAARQVSGTEFRMGVDASSADLDRSERHATRDVASHIGDDVTRATDAILEARGMVCAICLEDVTREASCVLACTHVYHAECIGKWLAVRRRCPVCNCYV